MDQCYVAKIETKGTNKNLLARKEVLFFFSSLMVLTDLFNSIYFYGPCGICTVPKLPDFSEVRISFA